MEQKNEALNAIRKYFPTNEGTQMYFHGTGTGAKTFADILQSGEKFIGDAPDMLIRKNDMAVIVEHFEFDCYKVTRKGSQSRREQSRIGRKEKDVIPTESGVHFNDKIHGTSSYDDYIQNVCRNFREHYLQINAYKENLKKAGLINDKSVIKVLFLIEDTSPLGSMVVNDSNDPPSPQPICLGQCREFLSLFEKSPEVNYVIACSMCESENIVWFIDQNEISDYQKESIDYSKMQFLDFEPQVLSFQSLISGN